MQTYRESEQIMTEQDPKQPTEQTPLSIASTRLGSCINETNRLVLCLEQKLDGFLEPGVSQPSEVPDESPVEFLRQLEDWEAATVVINNRLQGIITRLIM